MTRTLIDALKEVPDQRGRKGRQIALPAILSLSVAAMLAGADSLIAIFRWGRRLPPEALRLLGFPDGVAPCHATYHYVFQSIDGEALSRCLGSFARGDSTAGHIAIDGKTLRGSRRHDVAALHIVSAFSAELSAVIGDLVVAPEQNEITAALALLKSLPLDGAVITGDAIFCQREICRHIRDAKGHYLFAVKLNQPELHDAIAESFGDLSPLAVAGPAPRPRPDDLAVAETVEKGHGRLEVRRAEVSAEVVAHLGWPGAAQVMRIERRREIKGKASVEIAYFVTSLPKVEATPARLLGLARAHWGIENKLHWRRDVAMNEDRCRVRAGARTLASLRNLALALIRKTGLSTPAAREAFAADRSAAVQAVTERSL